MNTFSREIFTSNVIKTIPSESVIYSDKMSQINGATRDCQFLKLCNTGMNYDMILINKTCALSIQVHVNFPNIYTDFIQNIKIAPTNARKGKA